MNEISGKGRRTSGSKKSLRIQIESMKYRLATTKPRSHMRLKLHWELRELMLRELRREIRQDKAAA